MVTELQPVVRTSVISADEDLNSQRLAVIQD